MAMSGLSGHQRPRDSQPAVELIGITKAFPGVLANDRISLTVRRGEVHCLLGENGAGKSTLMSILSGMVRPDAGRSASTARDVDIQSPKHGDRPGDRDGLPAHDAGPQLTVLENLMLGEAQGIRLDTRGRAGAAGTSSAGSLGLEVDPDATTGLARPRPAAAARDHQGALAGLEGADPRRADLDADAPGRGGAERILARLKAQGLAVVLITHKLHEAIAMGDRVSVLSLGRVVGRDRPRGARSSSHERAPGRGSWR